MWLNSKTRHLEKERFQAYQQKKREFFPRFDGPRGRISVPISTLHEKSPFCKGMSNSFDLPSAFAEGLGLDAGKLLGKGDAGVLDVFVRVFPGDDVEIAVALS